MSAKTKRTAKVGELVEAGQVVRPNGQPLQVTGGLYVIDEPGVHLVDGDEITAKA